MLDLAAELGAALHAVSHVTGGGLAANLARVLPRGVVADVDRATWTPAPIFGLLADLGQVPRADLERTLNLGVGMVAVVDAASAQAAVRRLRGRGLQAWVLGAVRDDAEGLVAATADDPASGVTQGAKGVDGGSVRLVGSHRPA